MSIVKHTGTMYSYDRVAKCLYRDKHIYTDNPFLDDNEEEKPSIIHIDDNISIWLYDKLLHRMSDSCIRSSKNNKMILMYHGISLEPTEVRTTMRSYNSHDKPVPYLYTHNGVLTVKETIHHTYTNNHGIHINTLVVECNGTACAVIFIPYMSRDGKICRSMILLKDSHQLVGDMLNRYYEGSIHTYNSYGDKFSTRYIYHPAAAKLFEDVTRL